MDVPEAPDQWPGESSKECFYRVGRDQIFWIGYNQPGIGHILTQLIKIREMSADGNQEKKAVA
jgi:hypothetical protein